MIKLENIYLGSLSISFGDKKVDEIIKKENVHSVGELQELIKKYPNLKWEKANSLIERAGKRVVNSNEKEKETEIYVPKAYSDSRIGVTDKYVPASDLIVQSPTTEITTTFKSLRGVSIENIKRDIMLTDTSGVNALKSSKIYYKNIGADALERIVTALDLYTDQVERQAKLYDNWNDNLFYIDYLEKEQIVKEIYSDIILFFAYNKDSKTVWGNLSDAQKQLIISSAINNNKIDEIIKNRISNHIALYTTLPEIEELSCGNKKVLNRFLSK